MRLKNLFVVLAVLGALLTGCAKGSTPDCPGGSGNPSSPCGIPITSFTFTTAPPTHVAVPADGVNTN